MKAVCGICPHACRLAPGQGGFCRARANTEGNIVCANYGQLTAMALDPIEKKPLRRFMPGSMILSVGSYGCNLRCPFCQNSHISMAAEAGVVTHTVPPAQLIAAARQLLPQKNIGIAYTYNEPLIGYEYVRDCAALARQYRLKNVLVTNGYVCAQPLAELLPLIDAMNIDLKGFSEHFYQRLHGDLETVKRSIVLAAAGCHVEVTTLIIPGENDGEVEMERLAAWLATVDDTIPLHISRFFPQYQYADRQPTPVETVRRLAEIAGRHLKYVYRGNC